MCKLEPAARVTGDTSRVPALRARVLYALVPTRGQVGRPPRRARAQNDSHSSLPLRLACMSSRDARMTAASAAPVARAYSAYTPQRTWPTWPGAGGSVGVRYMVGFRNGATVAPACAAVLRGWQGRAPAGREAESEAGCRPSVRHARDKAPAVGPACCCNSKGWIAAEQAGLAMSSGARGALCQDRAAGPAQGVHRFCVSRLPALLFISMLARAQLGRRRRCAARRELAHRRAMRRSWWRMGQLRRQVRRLARLHGRPGRRPRRGSQCQRRACRAPGRAGPPQRAVANVRTGFRSTCALD